MKTKPITNNTSAAERRRNYQREWCRNKRLDPQYVAKLNQQRAIRKQRKPVDRAVVEQQIQQPLTIRDDPKWPLHRFYMQLMYESMHRSPRYNNLIDLTPPEVRKLAGINGVEDVTNVFIERIKVLYQYKCRRKTITGKWTDPAFGTRTQHRTPGSHNTMAQLYGDVKATLKITP